MKKRLVAFLLVLIMVLGMLPVSAMAAGSVVTARGSAENPIRIYENSGNQAETSNGSVQVPVGETVTDSGVLTFSTYSAIEGVQVSTGGFTYCDITSSNENVVKATGGWNGGVLTINFQGVGNGTARITVDYTCTCSKGAAANGYLIYNVTVGDGGSTDPSEKPNAPTASDIGAFPDAGKAVLLHCVDAGARGHDATASSLNKVQNGYSVGEVVENPGTYYNVDGGKITKEQFPWMCVVTVHAAPFIELYNSNFSESYGVHKLAGTSNATATLHWFWHNTYGWQYLENPPIQFNITRDTSEKTYTLTYDDNVTDDSVSNMPVPNPQTEKSNTGMVTFTVSNARPSRDGYTFKGWADSAAATAAQYQPGDAIVVNHADSPKTIYAVWECSHVKDNDGNCTVPGCTHPDSCCPKPEDPKPDVIPEPNPDDDNPNSPFHVWVKCITPNSGHSSGFLPISYVEGGYTRTWAEGQDTCTFVLDTQKYADFYSGLTNAGGKAHTATVPSLTQVYKYNKETGWQLQSGEYIDTTCGEVTPPTDTFTVTYTDGVDGKFFEDVVFSDLKSGVATPAFGKDPYHPGYTFAGWEPEVAETVTETVTYVAQWTPVEPTRDDIFGALNDLVTVTCINRFWKDGNKNMDCGQGQYAAKAGIAGQEYTLAKGANDTTWVVTFPVTNFVKSFKQDPAHNLYTKDTLSWYIRWENNAWTSAPVEPGVDDLVKLTHAPTDWREVAKIATGGKSDCIHTHCVNSGLNVCDYGITVPFVNFNEDVVSVVPEEGKPGSYIATFRVDKFVDARAKVRNDKNFPDAPRTHKRLTQETVRWRLYATSEADEKIGNNVLNHVWAADPVTPGTDDVCTIAHNWVVTFDPNGGTPVPLAQEVEYGHTATKPVEPTLKGYTFDGWYLDGEEEPFDFGTTITSDITLKAKWNINKYTVTFNSYGGTPVPPAQEVEYGLTATKPADPTLKGYTFAFWYLGEDEQNATAYDFDTPVTENITLTAKWNINKYTVAFNTDGGTPVPPAQEVEYGLTATEPAAPEKTGYTFDGWYLGDEKYDFSAAVEQNITLTAKWHITPHNIYAYARLNSYFAPLTTSEFDKPVTLNAATLSRLGLGSYNSLGYISIGSFDFDAMPLTKDLYFDDDPELAAALAKLAQSIALETGVSKDTAEKIAWTVLYKTVNEEDMAAGYPADDGYQLSGNLNLASVTFRAGAENVENMPAVNYTYDDGAIDFYDFYFAGDTITMPADPTREGYSFEGWSVKVLPDENDADHLDADGADDAADETLLKAGDTYTITKGGVIFTAQWKLNTYIIASDLRINSDTANLADGKTYAWTHRYGGNYGETIDYQPMFDALKARALAVDAANEPYDAEIKLCFPGNKNKLFNETILTYGQEGGGWNPGVKNTAYIWGYATTSYEVIFNSDGGSAVDTQIVKYGEKVVKPEDPTMKGYNFLGWFDKDGNPFDFDTEITHKTELKAQWEKKDYIIASDLRINGDTANLADGKDYPWTHRYGGKYEETIDYQPMFDALKARALEVDKANEPNPTKVDVELRFPGSSNLFNETILTYGQDGANWQAANNTAYIWGYAWTYYDVTFVTPEGATTVDAQLIKNGDCAAKPADPTKEGWKFLGWYADAAFKTEFNFDAPITKKTSVYAKFELTSTPIGDIYVRYDVLHIKQLPDGTYDLANAEVEHLSAKKDTTVTAVIKDYRATHHVNVNRTLSKLTGTAIQPYMGVDGKPVYTILSVYYDLDFHTLTFDTMGGSKIAPETVRHGLTVAKPKDPVNGGYIFDGWYTDKTFRHRYDFSTPLTEDITIYAKWFLIVLPGTTVKKTAPKLNTSDHFAYVQGYPDGTVKPAGNITRAETAAILFRLMDDASRKTYYSTKSGFRDVASGSWYNTYVATLSNAGVITDSSNGYFRPNEAITRAELAAMLAKFSETTGAANYFNDVSAKYWAANAIAICAKLGWITGYPDGTFRPDKNVTRAELMAMINRATGRAPKSADAFLPGMKTWIDNTSDKWYYLDVQEATNSHSYTVKGSETWTALTSDPNWSLYE